MTKEITKAVILQEIQDKFKLRDFESSKFLFDETVVPVYNVDPHLKKLERLSKTLSVTTTGALSFFGVPPTEQWLLHRYNITFMTGVYSIAGVFIGRPHASYYTYLDLTAAQTISYANDLPKDVLLRSGDNVYVNVDGYTSTGDLMMILEVTKEEVR